MEKRTDFIWARFSRELLQFIRSKVKNNDDAQDLLQEAFVRIHNSLPKLSDEQKVGPWVYAITRNLVNDHFRKRVFTTVLVDEPEKEEQHDDVALTKCMMPFIGQLPPKYREALQFIDLEGHSQKALAENLGLSYTAAKSRVQRGRAMLRELFTNCCHIEADKYGNIVSHEPKGNCACG